MKNNIKITITNVETGEVDTFECVTAVIGMSFAEGSVGAHVCGNATMLNVAAAFKATDKMKDDMTKNDPIFKKAVKYFSRKVKAVKVDD